MMTYRAHSRYVLIAGVAAICVALLGWVLLQGYDLATLLFFIFAALLLLLALRSGASRVEADAVGLTLFRPLAQPQRIHYRQVAQATEEGRVQRVIVILYYPLGADGLVELDAMRSLALPALEDQIELLHVLQTKTPH
jgi:uncharacterized membrane protein YfcA